MKFLVLIFQLMTVFQMSRTVTKQKHFTAKIVCFSCDQIYRSAASGVKMCHKRLIIRIDRYKNTL